MNEWLGALIAVVAGVVVGAIAARIVRSMASTSSVRALRESSSSLAGLALSVGTLIGLLVALGFVSPDDLDALRADAIDFFPKLLAALIIVIVANVASTFAASAVAKALAGTGTAARFAPMITKFAFLCGGAIIAAGQAGVDTTVINIGVAALLFGVAGALVLLIGLGGRQVAGEIAAGRAWRASLRLGDRIDAVVDGPARRSSADDSSTSTLSGIVVEVHPTAVEIDASGTRVFVPNSRLLDSIVARDRPEEADAEAVIERR